LEKEATFYFKFMKQTKRHGFIYTTLAECEDGELQVVRDRSGLQFVIAAGSSHIFLFPMTFLDPETNSYYIDGLSLSYLVLSCPYEDIKKIKNVFSKFSTLATTYLQVVVDNEKNLPYKKSDIELLLQLDLLPHEKQRLELLLNDFTYIYLIRDGDSGLTKIGRSNEPEKRLKTLIKQDTLQATPNNYFFITYWLDRIDAEPRLHETYKNKRARGEWFDLSEVDIEDIRRIYINDSEHNIEGLQELN
jgi:hypothetical protein